MDSWVDSSRGKAEIEFTDMDRAQKFIDMPKELEEIKTELRNHRLRTEGNYPSTMYQPSDNHDSTITQDKYPLLPVQPHIHCLP